MQLKRNIWSSDILIRIHIFLILYYTRGLSTPQLWNERTYAETTSNHHSLNLHLNSRYDTQQSLHIEEIILKQSEKIDQLLQQIRILLNQLTSIVSKLRS